MAKRADDPYAQTYAQMYARVFTHFAKASGDPAKAIARASGCSEPYLSQISRAQRLPSLDKTKDLDRALNADGCLYEVRRLIDRLQTQHATHGNNLGAQPQPSGQEDDPVRRRELLQATATFAAGATVAPTLAVLTQAWQDSAPALPGASVSQAMIDDWEDAAIIHAQRARLDPPAVVLAALANDFADMAPHLARKQPDPVGRDLAHAAASHAGLIAGKCVDLGNRREARRWWTKTRALSDESGDRLFASWLRGREALYRRGDPTENPAEVLTVAQDARRLAGDRASAPLIAALTAEAQALAQMGQHDGALATLMRAEATFDRLPTNTNVDSDWCRREEGLWFDKSLIYTLAGDVRHAGEAQDVLLGELPAKDSTAIAVQLHRAALHACAEPQEGFEEAARIIDALPESRRTARYLREARIALDVAPERARALPAARELRALTSSQV